MGEYKADRTQIGNTKSQNEILEQIKNERKTANNKIEKRKFHTPKRLAYNFGGGYMMNSHQIQQLCIVKGDKVEYKIAKDRLTSSLFL